MPIEIILFVIFFMIGIPALGGYFIHLKRKNSEVEEMVHSRKKEGVKRDLGEVEKKLIYVASEFEDVEKFTERAKEVSTQLSYEEAKSLINFFHLNPPVPVGMDQVLAKHGVFGVWMEVCQNAIVEILYNYKEQAVPLFFKIGFGEYDWTQYKAIYQLLRLANEGVEKENILKELRLFANRTTDTDLKRIIESGLNGF